MVTLQEPRLLAEQMSEKEQKPPPCLDPEKCPRVAACLESSKLCHELVAHLALRAPGNPAEESVARRLAWISMD